MNEQNHKQLVEESYDHGPQAETLEEAVRDIGKWLNERPNRPIDLRHVAMLCAHAQQSTIQEPDLTSSIVNDACWEFVRELSHRLPAPILNDLKPAMYAALMYYHREMLNKPKPVMEPMNAQRAAWFLHRFKHEEKLLGPNEQAALSFAIDALEAKHQNKPPTNEQIIYAAKNWGEIENYHLGNGESTTRITFSVPQRAGHFAQDLLATIPPAKYEYESVIRQMLDAMAPVSAYGRVGSRDTEQAALQNAINAAKTLLGEK